MATVMDVYESLTEPNYRYVVSISGGKDSAALAIYMHQKYPEIRMEYLFCDTECELPETYDYIDRLEAFLGVEIKKLRARDYLNIKDKPNRNSFDFILKEMYGGFLPSPRARWCTGMLKIKPFEKEIGDVKTYSFIGIRGDEDREGYIPNKTTIITNSPDDNVKHDTPRKKPAVISQKATIEPVYPFRDDGLGLTDIRRILTDSGLGLPKYYEWRSRSGCYFCFYQQIGEWQGLLERHPDYFEKAKEYENENNQDKLYKGKRRYTWVERKTLDEIEKLRIKYKISDMDATEGCAICHI